MKNLKEPAYPIIGRGNGLTKREYFAAVAMQGLCANGAVYTLLTRLQISNEAVEMADEVLRQLEKTEIK